MLRKNSRHLGSILIVFTVTLAVTISSNSTNAWEVVSKGDNLVVACENITIHAESDAFSNIVGRLKFGNRVTAIGLAGLFHLSSTDFSSKKSLERQRWADISRDKDRDPEPVPEHEYTRASWVQIGNGKYVSNSCLVTPENFKEQTIEKSQKKVDQIAAGKAKRGFSEEESGDLTAMRGAAGKAKGGPADYKAIDRLIDAAQDKIDFAALKSFRRAGRLGEFR